MREKSIVKDICLKFNRSYLLLFLCTGMTLNIFHCSGNSGNAMELLKFNVNGNINDAKRA